MSKTNSKNRNAPQQLPDILNGIADRLGIARAIRKKNTIRFKRENIFRGSLRRDDDHLTSVIREQPQNILLDPEIVGRHAVAGPSLPSRWLLENRRGEVNRAARPIVFFSAGDAAREFLPSHR